VTRPADILIIGGGVAGLQAACDLSNAGLRVAVLEARDRLGGRILTRHHASYPVELGAEFIHGRPQVILRLASEAGLRVAPVEGQFINKSHGLWLHGGETWSEVHRILGDMPSAAPDQTFQTYIDGIAASDDAKHQALGFVEGYHAADPQKVSVHWLIRTMKAEAAIGEGPLRLVDGYESLVQALVDRLDRSRCEVHLHTAAGEVSWEPGQVRVTAGAKEFSAERVIVTAPLSILKSGGIRFLPTLDQKEVAMKLLDTGPVIRVSLCFREKFWETRSELRDASFMFTDDPEFPTWWSSNPLPYPILTGWATGSHVTALGSQAESRLAERALEALGRILETSQEDLSAVLEAAFVHDWQADRFATGAYSYALAGGADSAKALAEPVEDTLFFAGEATDVEGHNGTVHGAMASGARAAQEVVKAFSEIPKRSEGSL
jgi:monoamine oxidase